MKNKRIRLASDIAMIIILPMLMAYSLIGEKFHEIIGTIIFVLFIIHHILNRKWYAAIFKGKYIPRRIFQTILDMLLLLFMVAQPVSGILMSKHLYTFIQVTGVSAPAREIHLFLAYWGFVLMCIHAGTHLMAPMNRLKKSRKKVWVCMIGVFATVSVYGAYAFIKRRLFDYMFLKSQFVFFDFSEPRVWFFMDYATVMVLFMFVGLLITYGLVAASAKDKKE